MPSAAQTTGDMPQPFSPFQQLVLRALKAAKHENDLLDIKTDSEEDDPLRIFVEMVLTAQDSDTLYDVCARFIDFEIDTLNYNSNDVTLARKHQDFYHQFIAASLPQLQHKHMLTTEQQARFDKLAIAYEGGFAAFRYLSHEVNIASAGHHTSLVRYAADLVTKVPPEKWRAGATKETMWMQQRHNILRKIFHSYGITIGRKRDYLPSAFDIWFLNKADALAREKIKKEDTDENAAQKQAEYYEDYLKRYFTPLGDGQNLAAIADAMVLAQEDLHEVFGIPKNFPQFVVASAKHAKQQVMGSLEAEPLSFESQVIGLHNALNIVGVGHAERAAILKVIRASTLDKKVPDNLLTDRGVLTNFIRSNYGDEEDSVQVFLDGFQRKLRDDHPLKPYAISESSEIFDDESLVPAIGMVDANDREALERFQDEFEDYLYSIEESLPIANAFADVADIMEGAADDIIDDIFFSLQDPDILPAFRAYLASFRRDLANKLLAAHAYEAAEPMIKQLFAIEQKVGLAEQSHRIANQWARQDSDETYEDFVQWAAHEIGVDSVENLTPEMEYDLQKEAKELLQRAAEKRGVQGAITRDPFLPILYERCLDIAMTEIRQPPQYRYRNFKGSDDFRPGAAIPPQELRARMSKIFEEVMTNSSPPQGTDDQPPDPEDTSYLNGMQLREIMAFISAREKVVHLGFH